MSVTECPTIEPVTAEEEKNELPDGASFGVIANKMNRTLLGTDLDLADDRATIQSRSGGRTADEVPRRESMGRQCSLLRLQA